MKQSPYEPSWANAQIDEVRTTCRLCLNCCGLIVRRNNGGISLHGDPDHPLSKGFLCIKGRSAFEVAGAEARIIHPLKRVGEKGSGKWEEVSWDEAVADISARLARIIEQYGGEAVCVESLPPKDYTIWEVFANAIQTPNFFKHDSHTCFTPQLIADNLTFGSLLTFPNLLQEELLETRTLVLWGVNPPESSPAKNVAMKRARDAGTKIVVIDPRPTASTRMADLWLRVRPGTDLALALGMISHIIGENLYDREFVERWTLGFDRLAESVKAFTPARVEEITGVDAKALREAAALIATNTPAALFTFIGLAMSGNVTNTIRALGLILAITGNVDRVGSNFIKGRPKIIGRGFAGEKAFAVSEELLKKQLSADKFPLLAGPSAVTPYPHPLDVIVAMETGKPYPVKALLTCCNPVTALEDSKRAAVALSKLDLLVVFELVKTPTAEFADYILPMTMHLESNAITEYAGLNFVAARKQALQPRGEAREEAGVLLEILGRLDRLDGLPFSDYMSYLDYKLTPSGLTFDEFTRIGYLVNPNSERKYEKGLLRKDGKPGFNTPTGKVELHSTTLEKRGYEPLPVYREPEMSLRGTPELAKEYPFVLMTGSISLIHYHGLGLQIPAFRKRHPDPLLEMSPQAAANLGLQVGDPVDIEVPGKKGKVRRKVGIFEGLNDNVVCAEGHWYLPEEEDQETRLWAANVNVLTTLGDGYDPVIGGSTCRTLLCRITKA